MFHLLSSWSIGISSQLCIRNFDTAHFNLTLTCIRLFNYSINISIYSLITCKYSKEQWCKHIHVTTNCMPSALMWNALVQNLLVSLYGICSYGVCSCRSYTLVWSMLEQNHYTSCEPSILCVKVSVELLFNLCSQTNLSVRRLSISQPLPCMLTV